MIRVELLGLPRYLARQDDLVLPVECSIPCAKLLQQLAAALPVLCGEVVDGDGLLLGGHVLGRAGGEIISLNEMVHPGEAYILFSNWVGG